jgi:hypothetical protein
METGPAFRKPRPSVPAEVRGREPPVAGIQFRELLPVGHLRKQPWLSE